MSHSRSRLRGKSGGSALAWVLASANGQLAALDYDFQNGRYYQAGQGVDPLVLTTTSRASTGTNLLPTSASGFAYSTFGVNVPRITSGLGLLVEEARTNLLLNSTVPATQTTASLDTGTYVLWVNGSGSATSSAGTATGSGFGAATQGTPNVFTLSAPGTIVVTTGGSLNAFQLELGAFGTALIVTEGVTATRAADIVTVTTPPTFGSAYTLFAKGTPFSATPPTTNRTLFMVGDTPVLANRAGILRLNTSSNALAQTAKDGGAASNINTGTAWATNTSRKAAFGVDGGNNAISFNGEAVDTGVAALPTGPMTYIAVGSNGATGQFGLIERIAVWPNTRLSNADLQRIAAP